MPACAVRECWGFGGTGVRVERFGDVFLSALRPFHAAVQAAHAAATVQAETRRAAREQAAAGMEEEAPQETPQPTVDMDAMPHEPSELTPTERRAFDALVAATHMRAEEIGERWVWNIAMARSLCEMVRRMPESTDELRLCWGMGGSGLRVQRHGDFLVAALAPHLAELRAARAPPAAQDEHRPGEQAQDEQAPSKHAAHSGVAVEGLGSIPVEGLGSIPVASAPRVRKRARPSEADLDGRTTGAPTPMPTAGDEDAARPMRRATRHSSRC
jgi:hypothetical protein